jgi:hypothetical protein
MARQSKYYGTLINVNDTAKDAIFLKLSKYQSFMVANNFDLLYK